MSDSFEQLQTFDESALEQLHELQVEGEPSFVGGLISDYLLQVKDLNQKIQACGLSRDAHGLERAAHKLKSSSAILGLIRVSTICLTIENAARSGETSDVGVKAIDKAVTEAIAALETYKAKLN